MHAHNKVMALCVLHVIAGADECGEIDDDKLLELLCLDDKNKVYVVRSKAAAEGSTPRVISQEILKRVRHLACSLCYMWPGRLLVPGWCWWSPSMVAGLWLVL